jgi:type II secretory pathway component GspD/PulD (secretin)
MLDPRRFRVVGLTTLGAVLAAGVLAKGCSSGAKTPEPAAKTAPGAKPAAKPADAAKKPATATPAKPGETAKKPEAAKPATASPAPKPAETAKKPEPAKPAATAAKPAEPAKKPEPAKPTEVAKAKPEAPKPVPVVKKEEPKPVAKPDEFPAPPPVVPPPAPARHEVVETEIPYEEAKKMTPQEVETKAAKARAEAAGVVYVAPGGIAPVVIPISPAEDAKNRDLMKALTEERRIELEKRKFLAVEYTTRGEEAFRALKYSDAKDFAMKALDQDSNHAPARTLLMKSRSALGERTGDVADLSREVAEMKRVKMDLAKEKATSLFAQGQAQMEKENFEGAISSFDDVLAVILQDPYGITWGEMKSQTETALREAKAARDRALEEARRKAAAEAYSKVKQEELARQVAEQQKFDSLMNDAFTAYDRDAFSLAEDLAGQALELRSTSSRALGLKEAAARGRHGQTTEETRRKTKEEMRRWRLEMEEATIPYSHVLNAPSREHWDRITRLRKDLTNVTGGVEESPETSALKNRLAQENTSFGFDGQTMSEAVAYLSARHAINIVIDDQVKADADAQPLPPFKLTNVTLKNAIELLLSNVANLTYRVRGNVVFITKPELARETPLVRIHPVGDLTMKINNFIAPNLILKPAGAEADENNPLFGKTEEGTSVYGGAEDLVTLIKDNVGDTPEVWTAEGVSIDAQGEANILVVAEPALQDGVARFLNDLRKFSGIVVNIESRFLSVTDNFLRDVGVDIRGLGGNKGATATLDDVTNGLDDGASLGFDNGGVGVPANASGKPSSGVFYNDFGDGDYKARTEHIRDGGLASSLTAVGGAVLQWTLLDDTQLSAILYAVEKKQEARVLQSPNLTVYNTQRANITLINQLAFVQDFDVEVAQTAFIADPQIAIIQDGLDLDVKPVVSNDRRYVTLQLQPTIATLRRPIQTFTTTLGAFTTPVTMQLPEINIQRAQTTVRVPNGGTLLLGGLKNIAMLDEKSETPFLSKIPIVSFFFSRRTSQQGFSNLLIVIRARITDLSEEQSNWGSARTR